MTPLFHQLIAQKKNWVISSLLNIGGIANITIVKDYNDTSKIFSKDIGPGNCLIDTWVRKNSNLKFDLDGKLASSGKINEIILEQAQELYSNRNNKQKKSFDTNDFDVSFSRGLSLEDGASTLTEFTASILAESLSYIFEQEKGLNNVIVSGGGRKNRVLIGLIKKFLGLKKEIKLIDDYGIDGDYIESQAFAFLAIRTFKKLPISFPNTTNCKKPTLGGEIINY